ncbi:reverse transcriptase [Phytophthora cinnamomi]|uniref:reverse transcriptase n=1 Tax=Phytophthora cinnamomi TaxID=4785 RepID=UPI00355A793F|nr:reverse transcriptase [Phytophthora cinnamomi]
MQISRSHFATTVCVPGSLGDSGFHRESPQEDVQGEFGQGNEVSTEIGSPTTPLNQDRSAERQSFGRSSTDGTEGGPATDLEDKPQPPPQVPSGTPAGLDSHLDPPDESPPAKAGVRSSTQPPSAKSTAKKKTARPKSSRKKIKAPDSEPEDRGDLTSIVSEDQLAAAYYKKELHGFLIQDTVMRVLRPKILGELRGPVSLPVPGSNKLTAAKALMHLLKEGGIVAGSFAAEDLFDLELSEIEHTMQSLFTLLTPLVGEAKRPQEQSARSKQITTEVVLRPAKSTPVTPGERTATSSPYVSATEDIESDNSEDSPRMTLGPSGAAMLRDLADRADRATPTPNRTLRKASTNSDRYSPEKLESFFQAAMERFLKEQRVSHGQPKSRSTGDQDVEMESVGSPNQPASYGEYNPDDLDLSQPARAAVATATTTTSGQTLSTPRIRVSAMFEQNEFSGKDGDEDRARSWISKVKSAFVRDQAPDEENAW